MEVRPATPPVAPPAAAPVFCKDCKHFNGEPALRFAQCMAPDAQIINLVYGYESVACDKARSNNAYSRCGPSGKLFVKADDGEAAGPTRPTREPYSKPAPSADSRSSLSKMNLASVQSSAMTVATASAEYPEPNTDSHMACAVTSRS